MFSCCMIQISPEQKDILLLGVPDSSGWEVLGTNFSQ